jgi:hypothetical protein
LEYDSIQAFDEESNKATTIGVKPFSRPQSRNLNRVIRVVNVLLILALLIYLYLRPSADLILSMLDTSILDLIEPGIDSSLTYDTTIPSNVD